MSSVLSGKQTVRLFYLVTLLLFACGGVLVTHAGIRGPGKYCGVVVFDRWDTCFLLSGPYITYISDAVKDELRPFKGKAMQIDASEVFQPMNPGDALVRQYKIIGPAPDNHLWAMLDGLELIAGSDFGPRRSPAFVLEIRNTSSSPVEVNSHEFGPTLLAQVSNSQFKASDGSSIAVITRGDLVNPSSMSGTVGAVTHSFSYTIDGKARLPERFQLNPGQSMKARITFAIPRGEYQFMFGYGGGVHEEKSLASNSISFTLSDEGTATLVE
jgi:hypothetical protein